MLGAAEFHATTSAKIHGTESQLASQESFPRRETALVAFAYSVNLPHTTRASYLLQPIATQVAILSSGQLPN